METQTTDGRRARRILTVLDHLEAAGRDRERVSCPNGSVDQGRLPGHRAGERAAVAREIEQV
jgi:hypothetical protein